MTRVVIAGGGLAGCLCALALRHRRPEVEILLVEEGASFGGNHTWSFFDTDIASRDSWILDGIEKYHWPRHVVRFPRRKRRIEIGYNSIRSAGLDRAVRTALASNQYRLGDGVSSVGPEGLTLQSGEQLEADGVIDARGPVPMPELDLGWQKFVGRIYRFPAQHGVRDPVIMDATVDQIDGYRFIYQLPISDTDLLIEDTYYSTSNRLDDEAVGARLDEIAGAIGKSTFAEEERGILPVVMGGDIDSFWSSAQVAQVGVRGGFFHPTTSYSLPDAVANAALLAALDDFRSASLHSLFSARAARLWDDRRFFRLLNRMLFRAADPSRAYRLLEHFYRLPPPVVARFYAAQTSALDKLRILSGRPPVPIARALAALRGRSE